MAASSEKLTREDLEQIIEQVVNSETDAKIDLPHKDLSFINLAGLNLNYFVLGSDDIVLEGCILDKENLDSLQNMGRRNLQKIVITDQNLGLSRCSDAHIGIAFNQAFQFYDVDLSNSKFINCNFDNVTFKQCILDGVIFENCLSLETARSVGCSQVGISHVITEYYEEETGAIVIIMNYISKIISLKFLSNLLGDGKI